MTSHQTPMSGGESLRPGMIVGRKFALISMLGSGGAGVVFEAQDTWMGRRVALKVLHSEVAADPGNVRRFQREARAAARINHPNIVAVHEIDQQPNGAFFIVQELLQGTTLRDILAARQKLKPMAALEFAIPIMGALVASHQVGVVHRDVKPENIFLARGPTGEIVPKLIDFGIAKVIHPPVEPRSIPSEELTGAHSAVGTPWYMSPEQLLGTEVDEQADIWAMGAVLFEALSGQLPFDAPTVPRVIAKVLSGKVPSLEELAPDLPPELTAVVQRAMMHDRTLRFRSMEAFLYAILAFAEKHDNTVHTRHARSLPQLEELDSAEVLEEDLPERPEPPSSRWPVVEWEQWEETVPDQPMSGLDRSIAAAGEALRINALSSTLEEAERAISVYGAAGEVLGRMRLMQAIAHRWLGDYAASSRCSAEAMSHLPPGSMGWCAAAGYLAMAHGNFGEAEALRALTEAILAHATGEHSPAGAIALCRAAVALLRSGMNDLAGAALATARNIAKETVQPEPIVCAWLDVAAAEIAIHAGDLSRYLTDLSSANTNFLEGGDVRNACLQRANIGNAYLQLGAYQQAAQILKDVLIVIEPMLLGMAAMTRANLGFALARTQRTDQALAEETAALDLARRQGDRRTECVALFYLGEILGLRGSAADAEASLRAAIAVSRGQPALVAHAQATLANLLLSQKRIPEALTLAKEAMDTLEALDGVEQGESTIRLAYVRALRAANRPRSAQAQLAAASHRLQDRAAHITDEELRRSFLQNVPENAGIAALSQELFRS